MTTSTSRPATRRRQHDSASLLQVAIRLFNERGYDGASMDAIAAAAGITKSSIYHHFHSKEEMLARVLDRAIADLDEAIQPAEQVLAGHDNALDAVESVIRRTTAALIANVDGVTLFLRVRGNSETERRAIDKRRSFDRRVTTLIQAAADAGQLRSDLDPGLVTRIVFGAINSMIEWYRPDGGLDPQLIEDQVAALALDGLRSR